MDKNLTVTLSGISFDLAGNDFLLPYLRRALNVPDDIPADHGDGTSPRALVSVRTDDSPVAANSDLPHTIIKCADIVGTGMSGFAARIARGIWRGTYVHIRGNEARVSTVHATDVANAAIMAAGTPGQFSLTDMTDHSVRDLAEAIAYRMDNKNIFTIPPFWARLWYGKSMYGALTTDNVIQCTFADAFPDFKPVSVTEYLKTHVYDENSL